MSGCHRWQPYHDPDFTCGGEDPAALAAALANVPTTLEKGLQTSERTGKPISAKFEIEEGKLRLSVYTVMTEDTPRSSWLPTAGNVIKAEKITDADDLKAAAAQKAAMEKASYVTDRCCGAGLRRKADRVPSVFFPNSKMVSRWHPSRCCAKGGLRQFRRSWIELSSATGMVTGILGWSAGSSSRSFASRSA